MYSCDVHYLCLMKIKEMQEVIVKYKKANSDLSQVKKGMEEFIKTSPFQVSYVANHLGFSSRITLQNRFKKPESWKIEEIEKVISLIKKVDGK